MLNSDYLLRSLDAQQRRVLSVLFVDRGIIQARDVQSILGLHVVTTRALCKKWVQEGFMVVKDPSKKNRTYGLNEPYETLAAKKMV